MQDSNGTEFAVSDKVVHPQHGAGQITGVEHQELMAGFKHYYVIDIHDKDLTVRVPVRKADELGIRRIMSSTELAEALNILRGLPQLLPDDYKKRQAQVQKRLLTSSPLRLAEVIRDLFWHGELDHLTKTDERLLKEGRDKLAAEMAFAIDSDLSGIMERIDAALKRADVGSVRAVAA